MHISISYQVFNSVKKLPNIKQKLIKDTIKMSENAYAPYSNFKVGAGLILSDKRIHLGTNVENAAFPNGNCAERNILSYVISNFPHQKVETIAVFGDHSISPKKQLLSPCGMCRQVLLETELRQNQPIEIILIKSLHELIVFSAAKDLLPVAFDGNML